MPDPTIQQNTKFDPNSIVDTLAQKGMPNSLVDRTALAGTYGMTGYTGTSAQNMALLAKVNGVGGSTDPKTISGSPSQGMNTATNNTMTSALTSIGGASPTSTTDPTGVKSNQYNADGSSISTLNDGTFKYTPAPQNQSGPTPAYTSNPSTYTGLYNPDGTPQSASTGYNYQVPAGTSPSLSTAYNQANEATNLTNQQYQSDLAAKQRALQANIDKLNLDKQNAVNAATTSYGTNNPQGSGSDREQYLSGIGSKYDTAISQATYDMNTQLTNLSIAHQSQLDNIHNQLTSAVQTDFSNQQQLKKDASAQLNTSIDNFSKVITGNPDIAKLFDSTGAITGSYDKVQAFLQTAQGMGVPQDLALPMMKAEVANSKAKQAALDSKAASDALAQRKQDALEAHQAKTDDKANAMLALAINRDQRADESAARQEVKQIEQDFLKTNTATQSLSVGQQYMARIEAASGEGVSALGLIDALVKLDTGGQAVRQGQTDILQESGTWGDAWERLRAKAGLSSKIGANTILTPNQVAQIKAQAKNIVKEQISAALPAYIEAKQGVDSIKTQYPSETQKIEGYSSQLKSAETLINKYGSAEDKAQLGLGGDTTTTSVPDGYYQASDGKYYKKQ